MYRQNETQGFYTCTAKKRRKVYIHTWVSVIPTASSSASELNSLEVDAKSVPTPELTLTLPSPRWLLSCSVWGSTRRKKGEAAG